MKCTKIQFKNAKFDSFYMCFGFFSCCSCGWIWFTTSWNVCLSSICSNAIMISILIWMFFFNFLPSILWWRPKNVPTHVLLISRNLIFCIRAKATTNCVDVLPVLLCFLWRLRKNFRGPFNRSVAKDVNGMGRRERNKKCCEQNKKLWICGRLCLGVEGMKNKI